MLSLKFLYNTPLGAFVTGWRQKKKRRQVVRASDIPPPTDDPLRAAYIMSVPRAQWFRGVLLQGYLVHPGVLQGLDDFEVRDDDVFIVTYPKSGTTWTEEIVSLIHEGGNPSRVQHKLLNERVEHLEVGRPLGHLRHLRRLRSPRLLATHLPLPLVPRALRSGKCKMIYVVRNPKDNAVSYYHHHRMSTFLGNYQGSWDDFLQLFSSGHLVYGSWFDHVLPYWRFCQEHPDRMLFVSYEDLKLDLPGMVQRIATFLGKRLSETAITTIASHCTFEQMKSNTMVNREVLPISDLFDMTQSKFMRKGIIGDWKNYFTEEQSTAFTKLYNEKMKNSGLELIFDPEEIDTRNNNATKNINIADDVDTGNNATLHLNDIVNGNVDNGQQISNIQKGYILATDNEDINSKNIIDLQKFECLKNSTADGLNMKVSNENMLQMSFNETLEDTAHLMSLNQVNIEILNVQNGNINGNMHSFHNGPQEIIPLTT